MTKIGIASDHAGYEMKEFLVGYLSLRRPRLRPRLPRKRRLCRLRTPAGRGGRERRIRMRHRPLRFGRRDDHDPQQTSGHPRRTGVGTGDRIAHPPSSPTTRPWRCSTPTSRRSSKADATSTASRRWPYPAASRLKNSRSGDACGSKTNAGSTDAMHGQRMRQVRIDGYDDPQTRQTFRQKQGKPDAACAHGEPGNAPASAGITSAQDRATPTTKR